MSNASLIPYNYVRKTLETCLVQHMQHGRTNFLIDDFPRSKEQTRFFDEVESVFSTKTFKDRGFIIYAEMESKGNSHFHCSEDVMLARMLKRAKTSGRVDDTTEVFHRRYARHMQDISSIMEVLSGNVIDVRVLHYYERNACSLQSD